MIRSTSAPWPALPDPLLHRACAHPHRATPAHAGTSSLGTHATAFAYFEITTLGFSVITKIPFFTCTLNFQKLYINIHKLYTNKHKFHANNYLPNL
jgi:hypothetical protein